MSASIKTDAKSGAIDRVVTWWHATRERWRQLHELQMLPPGDLERLAHESGLSVSDFRDLAAMPRGVPELLAMRLTALNLTPEEIARVSPLLLADLTRTCGKCGEKQQCAADHSAGATDDAWQHYCPNAGTLQSLRV